MGRAGGRKALVVTSLKRMRIGPGRTPNLLKRGFCFSLFEFKVSLSLLEISLVFFPRGLQITFTIEHPLVIGVTGFPFKCSSICRWFPLKLRPLDVPEGN